MQKKSRLLSEIAVFVILMPPFAVNADEITGINPYYSETTATAQAEPSNKNNDIDKSSSEVESEVDDYVKDPYEKFNRTMFTINEGIDTVILRPLAITYDAVTPKIVKKGVNNFFGNLNDVVIGVNNLLQGEVENALSDTGRIFFNSTIGIAGIFDVATSIGLEKHDNDFGQTLAVWGIDSGPFIFLPILGPRYVRDAVGATVDAAGDPGWWIFHNDVATRNSVLGVQTINIRANMLPMDKIIDEAALDKYTYIRDGYMQRRNYQIKKVLGKDSEEENELDDVEDSSPQNNTGSQ